MTPRQRATSVARQGASRLAGRVASPDVDARLLLAHVLGVTPGALVLAPPVDAEQQRRYAVLLDSRAGGVPLQHLTGEAWFRGVRLEVGPGVFIPRPETELVAGAAIDRAQELCGTGPAPVVVELCAGSGAISAALVNEVPDCRVVAVERDDEAVRWCRRNLAGTSVQVRHEDMSEAAHDLDGRVDLVVANPPYVPLTARDALPIEVTGHDPQVAVFSGEDGLDAIRVVEQVARRLLVGGGLVVCEHDDSHALSAPEVFAGAAWTDVRDWADLSGRPRWVSATRTGMAG